MLEGIMNVALTGPPRFRPTSRLDEQMRRARTCYDHVAGVLGVGLADRLTERGFVVLGNEAGAVTATGAEFCPSSASIFRARGRSGAFSAVPAWTGPNGGRTSAAPSARRWRAGSSS
jgi:hypothetical protein